VCVRARARVPSVCVRTVTETIYRRMQRKGLDASQ